MVGLTQRSLVASRPLFKQQFHAEVFPEHFIDGDNGTRGRRKYHDSRPEDSTVHHTLGTQRTRSLTPGPTSRAPHSLHEHLNDAAGMRSCRAERPGLLGATRSVRRPAPDAAAAQVTANILGAHNDKPGFFHFGFMPCSDGGLAKTGQLLFYPDVNAHVTPFGEAQRRRASVMPRSASCEPAVRGAGAKVHAFRAGRCGPPDGAIHHHLSATEKVTPPWWTFPAGSAGGNAWRMETSARDIGEPLHLGKQQGDRAQEPTASSYSWTSSRSGSRQPEWVAPARAGREVAAAGLASSRTPRDCTSRSREPSRERLSARSDVAPAGARSTTPLCGAKARGPPTINSVVSKFSPLGALMPERMLEPRAASCPPAGSWHGGSDAGSTAAGKATPRYQAPPASAGASPPAFPDEAGKASVFRSPTPRRPSTVGSAASTASGGSARMAPVKAVPEPAGVWAPGPSDRFAGIPSLKPVAPRRADAALQPSAVAGTPRADSARRSSASPSPSPRGPFMPRCDSARSSVSYSTNGRLTSRSRVSASTLGDYRDFSTKPRWR